MTNISMPVYVTRKTAGGMTGQLSLNAYVALTILMLLTANALLWGGIGIYEGIKLVVS